MENVWTNLLNFIFQDDATKRYKFDLNHNCKAQLDHQSSIKILVGCN